MFSKLGLQIYTVRDYMQDEKAIEETFEKLAAIGYTEGQTAGKESEEYARLAKKYGIDIVSIPCFLISFFPADSAPFLQSAESFPKMHLHFCRWDLPVPNPPDGSMAGRDTGHCSPW